GWGWWLAGWGWGAVQEGFRRWGAHEFSCDPSIALLVKKEWQSKCARRLSGIASKVCIDPSYVASWCTLALRAHMKKIRLEDEDFKRRSSQCSKNRLRNESQRVHHRQGSISAEEVKNNMEKELERLPTALELCYDGHVDNDGQFVNPKAKQVWWVGGLEKVGYLVRVQLLTHIMIDPHMRKIMIKSFETQVVELAVKNDDQKKELDQTKQELDQTKQELGETKQGLVETQTNLVKTQ
ncbi:Pheromone-processing carboxypeptidase KEX1, partial [Bienertia sinuspersici]